MKYQDLHIKCDTLESNWKYRDSLSSKWGCRGRSLFFLLYRPQREHLKCKLKANFQSTLVCQIYLHCSHTWETQPAPPFPQSTLSHQFPAAPEQPEQLNRRRRCLLHFASHSKCWALLLKRRFLPIYRHLYKKNHSPCHTAQYLHSSQCTTCISVGALCLHGIVTHFLNASFRLQNWNISKLSSEFHTDFSSENVFGYILLYLHRKHWLEEQQACKILFLIAVNASWFHFE